MRKAPPPNSDDVGAYKVFLPLISRGSSSIDRDGTADETQGKTCLWKLEGVVNGNYYIYAVAADSHNRTIVYSDTPVEVRK